MYSVSRSALVKHSAKQMFDLVNDVEGYKEFLPWCGGSKFISRGDDEYVASVTIAFKGIHKTFTTRNRIETDVRTDMALVDGPFSNLTGFWEFRPLDEASSKIILELEFGFSNRVVGAVVGPVFNAIADSMVDSFCKRADQVYGG